MLTPPRDAYERLAARVRPAVERALAARFRDVARRTRRRGPDVAAMVEAIRDLTLRGGKRYRAVLLAAAYLGVAPRAPFEVAIDAGAALELLQSYLLAQDDWMDGDAVRRGGPSVHAALGRHHGDAHLGASSALLAGDLAWGLAVDAIASTRVSDARRVAAVRMLCRVHEDVVVGQALDVAGRPEDVEAMHALKTGSYTVRGPLALGAVLAGATPSVVAALERFARPVGVAFQLRDDLLGAFAPARETGKRAAGDLLAGKRTAVVLEAEGRLDAAGKRALARVMGNAKAGAADVARAQAALEACGARAAVTRRLEALCRGAERAAAALPLAGPSRAALAGAVLALRPASVGPRGSR